MIKHLRFFMLNLLVLVSAAVMAQTTIDFTKLTWSNPLVQSPTHSLQIRIAEALHLHKTQTLKTSVFMPKTHSPFLQAVGKYAKSFSYFY